MVTEKRSLILGCLSKPCPSACRKVWNERFRREGVDAIFLHYPTEQCVGHPCAVKQCLHVRLAEMDLHHRFAYIIHEPFQQRIIPLLDALDSSAKEQGSVNVVFNEEGILKGYWASNDREMQNMVGGKLKSAFSRRG